MNIDTGKQRNTPGGTLVLAGVLLLSGVFILWNQGSTIYHAYSADANVVVHPTYYISVVRSFVTATTAVIAAVGLLDGRKWGWAMALFHCYWRFAFSSLLPIGGAILTGKFANIDQSRLLQATFAGVLFVLIILYLIGTSVMEHFQIDPNQKLRPNAIALGMSFPIALGLELLAIAFQRHFPSVI